MIELCNTRAREAGVTNLEFIQSEINDTIPSCDILYSLGFLTYYKDIDYYLDLFSKKSNRLIILDFPWRSENLWGFVLKVLCFTWAKLRSLNVNTHSKIYIDEYLSKKGYRTVKSSNFYFTWLVAYEKKISRT
jgi:hypothetical protein